MGETWVSYLDRFAESVKKYSKDTAIICGDRKFNYSELDGASNAVAKALQSRSVKREQIVPIVLPRSPEAFAAILGVWKAGAAGTFVNTAYPAERIEAICKQCGSNCVIDEKWIQELNPFGNMTEFENVKVEREKLAMVIFTSGSTGSPKGVLLPHRAISYRTDVASREIHGATKGYEREKEIWFSYIPLSSVIITSSELTIFIVGAKVDIAPAEYGMDMAKVIQYGLMHKITLTFAPPVLAPVLIKHFEGQIKCLAVGSEQIKNIYTDKMQLLNGYGASETAGAATLFVIDQNYGNTPIGKPLTGTMVYLLDSEGNPSAEGEIGELCISGECLALGYHNLPDLTAQKFTPNPFSDDPEHRTLYHTGDLARLLPNGNYEYIQRADWMLKVHGHRVEPGEIEDAIRRVAPVSKAVVVGFESRAEEVPQTRLYACYTAAEEVDPKKIQEDISRILPYYMVPSYIEQVPSLPLNINNKIDRSKIVPPEIEYFKTDYVEPADDMEKTICLAFQEVLKIPKIGALDNFILLGGDSISAAKAAFLLYKSTGLTVIDLLMNQTPRALASLAKTKAQESGTAEQENMNEIKIPEIFELSPYQIILFNEWQLDPDRYDYNIVEDNIFDGEISADRLNDSLMRLLNDYYFLNCNVAVENDIPCWKNRGLIAKDARIVQYFDHPLDNKQIFSIVSKPFDLSKDQLYRYILIKLADRKYRYIICVHHIEIDGTKGHAIHEEYAAYYNNPDYSVAADKDKQKILYSGYLSALQTIMNENKKNMIDFWRGYCHDAQPVDLKFLCRSAGASQEQESLSAVSICNFIIDQKDTDRVKIISQKYGITPYMYSKIIFALSLYRMSGQSNISFSYPVAIPEGLALMYGSQVNTMVIKFSFNRETTVEDLIQQTKNFYSEAEKNKARYLPINETIEFLPERKAPEINFAHSVQRYSKFGFNGVENETVIMDFLFDINYKLLIQMEEQSNRLLFEFKYKNRILDGTLVQKFSDVYQKLFSDILNGLLNEKK